MRGADPAFIETVYREILEPSFAPDELDPLDLILDGLTEGGSYELWGLCALEEQKPVGCILGYPYRDSGVLLIGYLVIRDGSRGDGTGGSLADEAGRRWYGQPGLPLVVAEVEDPRHYPVIDGIDPARRVAFYARRGAHIVAGPYFQPRLGGEGRQRVYDLFLTVLHGSSGMVSPDNTMPAQKVADFLLEYFAASGEGTGWPQDDEARWLLDWYRSRDRVILPPIGEYATADVPRSPFRSAG
jgi:hypothetical protein